LKAVILAGGYGTRLSEETSIKPKPMVEIGSKPILWHIMKIYSAHGINDFVICCGYKGYVIKEYFANYFLHSCDVTFSLRDNGMTVHQNSAEPWQVTLVDTGEHSMTGGRLQRVKEHVSNETFCFTYGDGVADIDIASLIQFHKEQGTLATLTAAQPPGRFGAFTMKHDENRISAFHEKPDGDGAWVNAGFFVLEPGVFDYIDGDETTWEKEPMERLAQEGEMSAYKHNGFWQPMDTLRDKHFLESMWQDNKAPWKLW
jgi:glucose-1-phosphate cytidylyltransferase